MSDTVRVGVDVGGTFTDAALVDTDGELYTAKVPTTADQSVGAIEGIEAVCAAAALDITAVGEFVHAMTVPVNALLERTGARTALVTTAGFRDVLEIGRQTRPDLYDLDVERPEPLVPRRRRFEIPERATAEGVEAPVSETDVREVASAIGATDAEAVAVAFLHAYAHPENERRVAALLREETDATVSISSEVLAEFREYERTATTVVDAYVTPRIDDYVGRLQERAAERGLPDPRIMQSNGGVATAGAVREHAVTTVLSGPAAGVVGANLTAASALEDDRGLVTLDMGGTSTDVSLVRDGTVDRTTGATVADQPIHVPMVDVTTVGAGGGSVARVDEGGALRVGPRSAGADPGPACYGRGGTEPTVTDATLVLGLLSAETDLGGTLSLDGDAAHEALASLADRADLADADAAARGVFRVANATMTRAIRSVTVERGHDPRELALVAFGGAGPVHAAALADRLGVETVLVPRACGVLSAVGLLGADETHDASRTHRVPLESADFDRVADHFADLEERVRSRASDPDEIEMDRAVDLRYVGQSFELTVPVDRLAAEDLTDQFHRTHERAHGYRMDDPVELVTLRATGRRPRSLPQIAYEGGDPDPRTTRPVRFGDEAESTPVYDRESLPPGVDVGGGAVLEGTESTVVVPPGWTATVRPDGTLRLEADS